MRIDLLNSSAVRSPVQRAAAVHCSLWYYIFGL
jgi:hypothetical protein